MGHADDRATDEVADEGAEEFTANQVWGIGFFEIMSGASGPKISGRRFPKIRAYKS